MVCILSSEVECGFWWIIIYRLVKHDTVVEKRWKRELVYNENATYVGPRPGVELRVEMHLM